MADEIVSFGFDTLITFSIDNGKLHFIPVTDDAVLNLLLGFIG